MQTIKWWIQAVAVLTISATSSAQGTTPHTSGTVKAIGGTAITVSTSTGQDVTVAVPDTAKVLVVAPGSKDLKSATVGSLADIVPTDKVIVTGTAGDSATSLTAARIILMKSQAIADTHAAESAAWTQGGGGIVRTVDPSTETISVANGLKTLTVTVTPATIVRRYSGDSIRFADAQASTVADIRVGDQLRVRGSKTPDGTSITADELVTGAFHNYSGLISSIDTTSGTVMLKDLTIKKVVNVTVTSNSDVRRIPAVLATRVAMQMKGSPNGAPAAAASQVGPTTPNASGNGPTDGAQRAGRAGMDLSSMLSRLPTETLAGLKVGDAVMIVATSSTTDANKSTAVTLLVGVDAILSASPTGQTMTLSPWSVGGDASAMGEGGGGGGR